MAVFTMVYTFSNRHSSMFIFKGKKPPKTVKRYLMFAILVNCECLLHAHKDGSSHVFMCVPKLGPVYYFLKIFFIYIQTKMCWQKETKTLKTINIVNATVVKIFLSIMLLLSMFSLPYECRLQQPVFQYPFFFKQNLFLTLRLFIFNTSWWHQKPEIFQGSEQQKIIEKVSKHEEFSGR